MVLDNGELGGGLFGLEGHIENGDESKKRVDDNFCDHFLIEFLVSK